MGRERDERLVAAARRGGKRARVFRPNYVSFAGTYQCNLACPHCCVPIEWTDRLPIPVATRFLEECRALGFEWLGFTGGEPFVYPDFVVALTRRGKELGFRFDKIVTNGAWHRDAAHLESTLRALLDAGFTGTIGVSVDRFHPVRAGVVAEFCRVAARVSKRDDFLSLNYASPAEHDGLEKIRLLAKELGGAFEWSDFLSRYLLVTDDLSMTTNWNHLAPVERAEDLASAWDGKWFEEDYCEGPGQAFIVNPKGDVKPCCGFASDLDQLTIGNIHEHSAREIVERGCSHPYVGKVFREGLTAIRDQVLRDHPDAIPGATGNHCFFCWFALTRGLAEGVPGKGGQVGRWTTGEGCGGPSRGA